MMLEGSQEPPTNSELVWWLQYRGKRMHLSEILIEKFRALHRQRYGEEIGYEEAERKLKELAELVRMTASSKE